MAVKSMYVNALEAAPPLYPFDSAQGTHPLTLRGLLGSLGSLNTDSTLVASEEVTQAILQFHRRNLTLVPLPQEASRGLQLAPSTRHAVMLSRQAQLVHRVRCYLAQPTKLTEHDVVTLAKEIVQGTEMKKTQVYIRDASQSSAPSLGYNVFAISGSRAADGSMGFAEVDLTTLVVRRVWRLHPPEASEGEDETTKAMLSAMRGGEEADSAVAAQVEERLRQYLRTQYSPGRIREVVSFIELAPTGKRLVVQFDVQGWSDDCVYGATWRGAYVVTVAEGKGWTQLKGVSHVNIGVAAPDAAMKVHTQESLPEGTSLGADLTTEEGQEELLRRIQENDTLLQRAADVKLGGACREQWCSYLRSPMPPTQHLFDFRAHTLPARPEFTKEEVA